MFTQNNSTIFLGKIRVEFDSFQFNEIFCWFLKIPILTLKRRHLAAILSKILNKLIFPYRTWREIWLATSYGRIPKSYRLGNTLWRLQKSCNIGSNAGYQPQSRRKLDPCFISAPVKIHHDFSAVKGYFNFVWNEGKKEKKCFVNFAVFVPYKLKFNLLY